MRLDELQERLNYHFTDVALLRSALDRRSLSLMRTSLTSEVSVGAVAGGGAAAGGAGVVASTAGDTGKVSELPTGSIRIPNHETLEYLGDRVLNLCVLSHLVVLHPEKTPGQLQNLMGHYIQNTDIGARHGSAFYRVAKALNLESHLLLDPGDSLDKNGPRGKIVPKPKPEQKTKEHLLSDHLEALFAAIFLDSGRSLDRTMAVFIPLFSPLGLFDPDHSSVSEYGDSAASASVEDEVEGGARGELGEIDAEVAEGENQLFLSLATVGNEARLKELNLRVDPEIANKGFLLAAYYGKVNVVPVIYKSYPITQESVETALGYRDLPIQTRRFLEKQHPALPAKAELFVQKLKLAIINAVKLTTKNLGIRIPEWKKWLYALEFSVSTIATNLVLAIPAGGIEIGVKKTEYSSFDPWSQERRESFMLAIAEAFETTLTEELEAADSLFPSSAFATFSINVLGAVSSIRSRMEAYTNYRVEEIFDQILRTKGEYSYSHYRHVKTIVELSICISLTLVYCSMTAGDRKIFARPKTTELVEISLPEVRAGGAAGGASFPSAAMTAAAGGTGTERVVVGGSTSSFGLFARMAAATPVPQVTPMPAASDSSSLPRTAAGAGSAAVSTLPLVFRR